MIEWFDDLEVGMRFKGGEVQVTESDIKRFAAEFDPQPFHLDNEAAKQTLFKGLAASGWHTAALAMRLAVELKRFGPHPRLGLGVDNLRWLAPVRPGDTRPRQRNPHGVRQPGRRLADLPPHRPVSDPRHVQRGRACAGAQPAAV